MHVARQVVAEKPFGFVRIRVLHLDRQKEAIVYHL